MAERPPTGRAGTQRRWFVASAGVHAVCFALAAFLLADDAHTQGPRCLDFAALHVSPPSESVPDAVSEPLPDAPEWAELPPVLILPPEPPAPTESDPAPTLEPLPEEPAAPGVPPPPLTPPDRRVRPAKTAPVAPTAAVPAPPVPRPAAPVRTSVSAPAGSVEEATEFGTNLPPAYPVEARASGVSGEVVLRLRVDRDGRVTHVAIARSSGSALLDEAARVAAETWRFAPARRDGLAVGAVLDKPVRFALTGGR